MSRTYRRKNTTQNGVCSDLDYFVSEWVFPFGTYPAFRVKFPEDSTEYKRGLAEFHSDGGTTSFKEPGPSWYRRMFKRKYTAKVRRELHNYLNDPDYEVDLHDSTEKYKMDYWT